MRVLLFVAGLSAFAGGALIGAAGAQAPEGTQLGARATDPDGSEWAVRTWRASRPRKLVCLQAGRLSGGRLVRDLAGRERELRRGDRAVCQEPGARGPQLRVLAVERLVDDPAAPTRFTRTVVTGFVREGTPSVTLTARGQERVLPVDAATATFLAVLDGGVRVGELAVRAGDSGRDLGEPESGHAIVEGSLSRPLEVPDPLGGPPLAVLRYRTEEIDWPCTEAGRAIAGEVGPYESAWGSFQEVPRAQSTSTFADDWAPATPSGSELAVCGQPEPGEIDSTFQRYDGRLVVIRGVAGEDVVSIELRTPAGRREPVALRDGVYLAPIPSTGTLNERAVLVASLRGGGRYVERLALGERDVPNRWEAYSVLRGGRMLRVRWTTGFQPFAGVEVRRRAGTLGLTVLDRYGPSHTSEGYAVAYASIAIQKCADVVLRRPVGDRVVTTGRAGNRPRRAVPAEWLLPGRPRCRRVRPGQRLLD